MTQDIMNKPIVLQLNGNWQPIGCKSVKDAIIAMTSVGEQPPALALDISYEKGEDGEYDFSTPTYMNAVGWEDWTQLEPRNYDFVVHSSKMTLRVPTVIIAPNFRKMPLCKPSATKSNIYERDGGVCQYTGKKLTKGAGNIDHIHPQSRGGKNTWDNMVWCDKTLNSIKGDRTPDEMGWTLIRKPKEPIPAPISLKYREAKHPTWIPFIIPQENAGSN
jgi:hypothetical protein